MSKRLFLYQNPLPMSPEALTKAAEAMKRSLAAAGIEAEVIGLSGGEQLIEVPTDQSDAEIE